MKPAWTPEKQAAAALDSKVHDRHQPPVTLTENAWSCFERDPAAYGPWE